ncbi:UNVERIFIED_CONTAM: hypothetical protein Slati_3821700 [Sesamum latifolium]|uniref:Uncharacterized protein n=1 Tax=Sesamum latifolium TaxID=2727402 RepID=A0AAW2TLI7_9LAMI
MARSNKYTSLNFNGIFEKKLNDKNQPATNNSSAKSFANQSNTVLSNSRIHGHMLVLSRPAPKPISVPQKPENKDKRSSVSSTLPPDQPQADSRSDSISLRPQGRTGSGPVLNSSPSPSPVSPSPAPVKSDRFVPPHLRPGFVGREENPGPELAKGGPGSFKVKPEFRGHRSGQVQDPGHYGLVTVDGRPKSGGGYEPITRDRELADPNRPGSTGTRPSSSV